MCQPDFFSVEYEINHWMKGNVNQAATGKAQSQWQDLMAVVEKCAKVTLIEPQKGLPDMVFTANGALIHKNKAVVAKFQPKERQGEENFFKDWFKDKGFEVCDAGDEPFEGAGDALFDRGEDRLWAAHGFRSSLETHKKIQEIIGVEVLSLELVDPRFYHLDTCFCPLEGGYLMYYPKAFSPESQELIISRVAEEKLIRVSEDDANNFALNAVNVGSNIIMHKASAELRSSLEKEGFTVFETPVDEFMKAGGSTKCLTLRLDEH